MTKANKIRSTSIFPSLWLLLILSLNCKPRDHEAGITIAAASNMQFALEAITDSFTKNTGIPCKIVLGSSGKLTAQIREGAPYDVLLSADMAYPLEIAANGLAATPPKSYADGRLVLWTVLPEIPLSLDQLDLPTITHIGIANPKTAPYGRAAVEVLKIHDHYDSLKHKLVYGESISQTNQFIASGAAEIGFTAMSVVRAPELRDKGRWVPIASNSHSPISQGIVVIKGLPDKQKRAVAFQNFIFSEEAQEILSKFGYWVNE